MCAQTIKSDTTLDFQSKLNYVKSLTVTAGVRNLLDQEPPLSVRDTGGGNQVGDDGCYADPLGHTCCVTAAYKF